MTVIANLDSDQGSVTINIPGDFNLSHLDEFRQVCQPVFDNVTRFFFDLEQLSTLDPSALGMLLMFGDEMKDNATSHIINCNPDVARMLTFFNLNEIFSITTSASAAGHTVN